MNFLMNQNKPFSFLHEYFEYHRFSKTIALSVVAVSLVGLVSTSNQSAYGASKQGMSPAFSGKDNISGKSNFDQNSSHTSGGGSYSENSGWTGTQGGGNSGNDNPSGGLDLGSGNTGYQGSPSGNSSKTADPRGGTGSMGGGIGSGGTTGGGGLDLGSGNTGY
jgi:hypothetical protein